ncbi:hypothetical protein PROFUN_03847 [Planoprotostelium fungivorum]|uniref:EGF-like domain-containing protein n=1 Tax=Planoprotostelium fungivorum TaxID=1890364 RepID=A0A2P6NID0_9EUKA|nr:hypothetical protein PROFUN_03847 [Planoprotostelium fungivorum]
MQLISVVLFLSLVLLAVEANPARYATISWARESDSNPHVIVVTTQFAFKRSFFNLPDSIVVGSSVNINLLDGSPSYSLLYTNGTYTDSDDLSAGVVTGVNIALDYITVSFTTSHQFPIADRPLTYTITHYRGSRPNFLTNNANAFWNIQCQAVVYPPGTSASLLINSPTSTSIPIQQVQIGQTATFQIPFTNSTPAFFRPSTLAETVGAGNAGSLCNLYTITPGGSVTFDASKLTSPGVYQLQHILYDSFSSVSVDYLVNVSTPVGACICTSLLFNNNGASCTANSQCCGGSGTCGFSNPVILSAGTNLLSLLTSPLKLLGNTSSPLTFTIVADDTVMGNAVQIFASSLPSGASLSTTSPVKCPTLNCKNPQSVTFNWPTPLAGTNSICIGALQPATSPPTTTRQFCITLEITPTDCGSGSLVQGIVCPILFNPLLCCTCISLSIGFDPASRCSGCRPGYYGNKCANCTCVHGKCNDGKYGDGSCTCEKGWTGVNCDIPNGYCSSSYINSSYVESVTLSPTSFINPILTNLFVGANASLAGKNLGLGLKVNLPVLPAVDLLLAFDNSGSNPIQDLADLVLSAPLLLTSLVGVYPGSRMAIASLNSFRSYGPLTSVGLDLTASLGLLQSNYSTSGSFPLFSNLAQCGSSSIGWRKNTYKLIVVIPRNRPSDDPTPYYSSLIPLGANVMYVCTPALAPYYQNIVDTTGLGVVINLGGGLLSVGWSTSVIVNLPNLFTLLRVKCYSGTTALNSTSSLLNTPLLGISAGLNLNLSLGNSASVQAALTLGLQVPSITCSVWGWGTQSIVVDMNHPPQSKNTVFFPTQDSPFPFKLTGSDSDGNQFKLKFVTLPSQGNVTVVDNNTRASLDTFYTTFSYSFLGNQYFNGNATLSFVLYDGCAYSTVYNVTFVVAPVYYPPQASNITLVVQQGSQPNVIDFSNYATNYFNGNATLSFVLYDGCAYSTVYNVTFVVAPVYYPPQASNITLVVQQGSQPNVIDFSNYATNVPKTSNYPSVLINSLPGNGRLTDPNSYDISPYYVAYDRTVLFYTGNFVGNTSFSYYVQNARSQSALAYVTVAVQFAPHAPTLNAPSDVTCPIGGKCTIPFTVVDVDSPDTETVTLTTGLSYATATYSLNGGANTSVTTNGAATLTPTVQPGTSGYVTLSTDDTAQGSIGTVQLSAVDSYNMASDPVTVYVSVSPNNNPTLSTNNLASTTVNGSTTFTLVASDVDGTQGKKLSLSIVTPAYGTLTTSDGTVLPPNSVYTVPTSLNSPVDLTSRYTFTYSRSSTVGNFTLSYTFTDVLSGSTTGQVQLIVPFVDTPPTLTAPVNLQCSADSLCALPFSVQDPDINDNVSVFIDDLQLVNSTVLFASAVVPSVPAKIVDAGPIKASYSLSLNISYLTNPFAGKLSLRISDAYGGQASQTININVKASIVPAPPTTSSTTSSSTSSTTSSSTSSSSSSTSSTTSSSTSSTTSSSTTSSTTSDASTSSSTTSSSTSDALTTSSTVDPTSSTSSTDVTSTSSTETSSTSSTETSSSETSSTSDAATTSSTTDASTSSTSDAATTSSTTDASTSSSSDAATTSSTSDASTSSSTTDASTSSTTSDASTSSTSDAATTSSTTDASTSSTSDASTSSTTDASTSSTTDASTSSTSDASTSSTTTPATTSTPPPPPINHPPAIVYPSDSTTSFVTYQESSIGIAIVVTATDEDSGEGQNLNLTLSNSPTYGTLYVGGVTFTAGSTLPYSANTPGNFNGVDSSNWNVTYVPAGAYTGSDSFSVYVTDPHGSNSAVRTVNVLVNAVNHPPSLSSVSSVVCPIGGSCSITANIFDSDNGDSETLRLFSVPTKNVTGFFLGRTSTDLNVVSAGILTYGFYDVASGLSSRSSTDLTLSFDDYIVGPLGSFTLQALDASNATSSNVTVTVTAAPSRPPYTVTPRFDQGVVLSATGGIALNFSVTATDKDGTQGGKLTLILSTTTSHGTLSTPDGTSLTSGSRLVYSLNNVDNSVNPPTTTFSFSYVPPQTFNGVDIFKYRLVDPTGTVSALLTAQINVTAVILPPAGQGFDLFLNAGDSLSVDKFSANDPQGLPLTLYIDSLPQWGDLMSPTGLPILLTKRNSLALSQDQWNKYLTYASPLATSGSPLTSFSFHFSNGKQDSPTYAANIYVANPGAAPTAGPTTLSGDVKNVIRFYANVTDHSNRPGTLTVQLNSPTQGRICLDSQLSNCLTSGATFYDEFTPLYYVGPSGLTSGFAEEFNLTATDIFGRTTDGPSTVYVRLTLQSTPPTGLFPTHLVTYEGSPVTLTLNGLDDITPASRLIYKLVDAPTNGNVSLLNSETGATLQYFGPSTTVPVLLSGNTNVLRYTPPSTGYGVNFTRFSIEISDEQNLTSVYVVTVDVIHVNAAPALISPATFITLWKNTEAVITLVGTDTDSPLTSLTASITKYVQMGSLYTCDNGTTEECQRGTLLGTENSVISPSYVNSTAAVWNLLFVPVANTSRLVRKLVEIQYPDEKQLYAAPSFVLRDDYAAPSNLLPFQIRVRNINEAPYVSVNESLTTTLNATLPLPPLTLGDPDASGIKFNVTVTLSDETAGTLRLPALNKMKVSPCTFYNASVRCQSTQEGLRSIFSTLELVPAKSGTFQVSWLVDDLGDGADVDLRNVSSLTANATCNVTVQTETVPASSSRSLTWTIGVGSAAGAAVAGAAVAAVARLIRKPPTEVFGSMLDFADAGVVDNPLYTENPDVKNPLYESTSAF